MGKKKNRKSTSHNSSNVAYKNEFTSFQDEVIQCLQSIKESGGLVTGFNAVMRELEKKSLCVVIYISRKGTPAMYRALNLICKGKDVLFFQLQDINSILLSTKIHCSTSYGIKTSVIDQPKFSKLLEKINIAKSSRRESKEKKMHDFHLEKDIPCLDNKDLVSKNEDTYFGSIKLSETGELKNPVHCKHRTLQQKHSGNEGLLLLQEVDFPRYRTEFNQIAISIL